MRRWPVLFLFFLPALAASASPADPGTGPGAGPGAKPGGSSRPATALEVLSALRQGGDTYADALPIEAVPFTDSGTTIGYTDDYDSDCFTGVAGNAPDVVYRFTAPATGSYKFDLCGSAYDTKLYVYETHGSLLACNDDYDFSLLEGDPCYLNARIDDFAATGGAVYYLVVDGFSNLAGEYTLSVTSASVCDVAVSGNLLQEGEPALATGQDDAYNCGCTCNGAGAAQDLTADPSGQVVTNVVQGWRDIGERDRDWFRLTAGAGGAVHVEFESEIAATFAVYGNADCSDLSGPTLQVVTPCAAGTLDVAVTPGARFYIQCLATQMVPPLGMVPASYDAVLTVSGLAGGVPVAPTTWGELKSLYR